MTMPLDLPLEYQYRAADPKAGVPWLLVLMHGVGSNAVSYTHLTLPTIYSV